MKFYTVSDDYIKYLATHDKKISHNKTNRPYVGVVLEFCEHRYFAPLSSKNPNYKNDTIFKIHEKGLPDEKLGVLHLNNMIPVLSSEIAYLEFLKQREDYKNLLTKQFDFIKSEQNAIKEQAKKLHTHVTVHKTKFYCNLSCDFSALESIYLNYGK